MYVFTEICMKKCVDDADSQVLNTVVDTVVQHQVQNVHVVRPTVVPWHSFVILGNKLRS